jgi:hypothetical protein
MAVAYGVRRSTGNPLGVVSALAGAVGALSAMVLWLYQMRPDSPLFGSNAFEMGHGGPLRDTFLQVAAGLGFVALLAALLSCIGARTMKASGMTGIVLGAIALSYPVLAVLGLLHSAGTLPF